MKIVLVAPLTTFDVEKKNKINKSLSLRPLVNQQYKGLLYNIKAKCADRCWRSWGNVKKNTEKNVGTTQG